MAEKKGRSGKPLTRAQHRALGQEQLALWLPAELVSAVRAMAKAQKLTTTQLVASFLTRAVEQRKGER